MTTATAARYARALADVVMVPTPGTSAEKALAELRDFSAAVGSSVELRHALQSPAVSAGRKRSVVSKLAEPMGISEKVRNFLFVVIDHRRTNLLPAIVEAFEAAIDERMGRVRADVRTARELTGEQRRAIAAALAGVAGMEVRCEFGTDEELLGGVTASVGSTVYDGSVRGRLESLHRRMVAE
jgi:F-type H+-transporting ATPase subunit delta